MKRGAAGSLLVSTRLFALFFDERHKAWISRLTLLEGTSQSDDVESKLFGYGTLVAANLRDYWISDRFGCVNRLHHFVGVLQGYTSLVN